MNNLYHGSARRFNKFSSKYFSSGDGLDKYGRGVYLSYSREVAEKYARDVSLGGKPGHVMEVRVFDSARLVNSDAPLSLDHINKVSLLLDDDARGLGDFLEQLEEYGNDAYCYKDLLWVLEGVCDISRLGIDGMIVTDNGTGAPLVVVYDTELLKIVS